MLVPVVQPCVTWFTVCPDVRSDWSIQFLWITPKWNNKYDSITFMEWLSDEWPDLRKLWRPHYWRCMLMFQFSDEFNIYYREAGAGALNIAIEGPSKAFIEAVDRGTGYVTVGYIVHKEGRCHDLDKNWHLFTRTALYISSHGLSLIHMGWHWFTWTGISPHWPSFVRMSWHWFTWTGIGSRDWHWFTRTGIGSHELSLVHMGWHWFIWTGISPHIGCHLFAWAGIDSHGRALVHVTGIGSQELALVHKNRHWFTWAVISSHGLALVHMDWH